MNTKPADRDIEWWWRTVKDGALACLGLFVVAFLLYPKPGGFSKLSAAKSRIWELESAIDQFHLDCKRYPTGQEGLNALVARPKGLSDWKGPYLRAGNSIDPWGNPYAYKTPGPTGKGYEVESYGADGKPGGEGDGADITDSKPEV